MCNLIFRLLVVKKERAHQNKPSLVPILTLAPFLSHPPRHKRPRVVGAITFGNQPTAFKRQRCSSTLLLRPCASRTMREFAPSLRYPRASRSGTLAATRAGTNGSASKKRTRSWRTPSSRPLHDPWEGRRLSQASLLILLLFPQHGCGIGRRRWRRLLIGVRIGARVKQLRPWRLTGRVPVRNRISAVIAERRGRHRSWGPGALRHGLYSFLATKIRSKSAS